MGSLTTSVLSPKSSQAGPLLLTSYTSWPEPSPLLPGSPPALDSRLPPFPLPAASRSLSPTCSDPLPRAPHRDLEPSYVTYLPDPVVPTACQAYWPLPGLSRPQGLSSPPALPPALSPAGSFLFLGPQLHQDLGCLLLRRISSPVHLSFSRGSWFIRVFCFLGTCHRECLCRL